MGVNCQGRYVFSTLSTVTNQFFYFYMPLLILLIISLHAFYCQICLYEVPIFSLKDIACQFVFFVCMVNISDRLCIRRLLSRVKPDFQGDILKHWKKPGY